MPPTLDDILAQATVIPVLVVDDVAQAAPLARALRAGGLHVAEMTLRTPAALDALRAMKDAAPDLIVGMGTVRTRDQLDASIAAGAEFLVTPGTPPSLADALVDSGAPALPGVATLTEALTLHERGLRAQKFFPAEPAGGIAYLKAMAGPAPDIRFCPTGGISKDKAAEYLALQNVACVGGSWVATAQQVAAGDWAGVEANARIAASMGGV